MTPARVLDAAALTGPRWSSAVRCPRIPVYQALKAPATPHPPHLAPIFARGHRWGKIIADEIARDLRDQGIVTRRELGVPWPPGDPIGELHIDAYSPRIRRVFEIKSNAGAVLTAEAALQTAGQVLAHPRAEEGVVVAVDTHTHERRDYPINITALTPSVEELWDP